MTGYCVSGILCKKFLLDISAKDANSGSECPWRRLPHVGHFEGIGRKLPQDCIYRHDLLRANDASYQAESVDPHRPDILAVQEKDTRHICSRRIACHILHHLSGLEDSYMLANNCVLGR